MLLRTMAGAGGETQATSEVRCSFKPIMFTLKLTQGAICFWANLSWAQCRAAERVISLWPGQSSMGNTLP